MTSLECEGFRRFDLADTFTLESCVNIRAYTEQPLAIKGKFAFLCVYDGELCRCKRIGLMRIAALSWCEWIAMMSLNLPFAPPRLDSLCLWENVAKPCGIMHELMSSFSCLKTTDPSPFAQRSTSDTWASGRSVWRCGIIVLVTRNLLFIFFHKYSRIKYHKTWYLIHSSSSSSSFLVELIGI